MEYVQGGTLENLILHTDISPDSSISVLQQLVEVLNYLHNHEVIHRDIKPANILIIPETRRLTIKLCDFSLSRKGSLAKTLCGTGLYVAPEVFSKQPYDARIDIWSVGVVVIQTCKGLPRRPTQSHSRKVLDLVTWTKKISNTRFDSLGLPAGHAKLLSQMLRLSPTERPSASEASRELFSLDHEPCTVSNKRPIDLDSSETKQHNCSPEKRPFISQCKDGRAQSYGSNNISDRTLSGTVGFIPEGEGVASDTEAETVLLEVSTGSDEGRHAEGSISGQRESPTSTKPT